MSKVIKLLRKPRPLKKTYSTAEPYVVERVDQEYGAITYEVMDERPASYRLVCSTCDDDGGNPYAKYDAEQIARGLNLMVQYGKEKLPNIRDLQD